MFNGAANNNVANRSDGFGNQTKTNNKKKHKINLRENKSNARNNKLYPGGWMIHF